MNQTALEWAKVLVPAACGLAAAVIALRVGRKVEEVHISLNSRLTELVKATRAEGHAEGVEQERGRQS